jgi:hypothetical protein
MTDRNDTTERQWSDPFGHHFEVTKRGPDGRLYSMKITKTARGWSPSWDEVRKRVAAIGGDV